MSRKDLTFLFWTSSRVKSTQRKCTNLCKESVKENWQTSFLGDLLRFKLPFPTNHPMSLRLTKFQEWCLQTTHQSDQFSTLCAFNSTNSNLAMLTCSTLKKHECSPTIWMNLTTLKKWSTTWLTSTKPQRGATTLNGDKKGTTTEWTIFDNRLIHLSISPKPRVLCFISCLSFISAKELLLVWDRRCDLSECLAVWDELHRVLAFRPFACITATSFSNLFVFKAKFGDP